MLTNAGTAADVVYTLPATANQVFLEDDGTSGNGLLQLRSANGTFDTTVFANPAGSLTINRGNSADTITVNSLPDFSAGLTIGTLTKPFSNVTFTGALNLAANNGLAAFCSGTINLPNATSDLATIGSGGVNLVASRAIVVATNASITTVNGGITLSANQQTPIKTGNFTAISINGAVSTTGTGDILLTGTAGDDTTTASHRGVDIFNGVVRSTSTVPGAGKITINGTGGVGTDHNSGVVVSGTGDVESVVGSIQINGVAGAGSTNFNRGVAVLSGGQVKSTGTGNSAANIVIVGTGGAGTDSNFGVEVFGSGTLVSTVDGDIGMTGTGSAAATGSFNYGFVVFGTGQVTSTGIGSSAGQISISGTAVGGSAGASNNNGTRIEGNGTIVSSTDGNIAITGNASTSYANKFAGVSLVSNSLVQISGAGRLSMTGTAGVSGNQIGNAVNLASAISVVNSYVTVVGDTMFLDPANLKLNTAKVTLLPKTPGRAIDLGQASVGTTSFDGSLPVPSSPVTVAFQTVQGGSAANNGVIHFAAAHLGPVSKPQVSINNALPADLSVTMNLDTSNATATTTFASGQSPTNLTFDAGLDHLGALGNGISITFTKANRQGQGPLVTFGGANKDHIAVVLDTTGTTAGQLTDAINNNPLNFGNIIIVTLFGSPDADISNTPVTFVQLTGGRDASTAQDVIDAINSAAIPPGQPNAGQVVQATLAFGSGNTVVALDGVGKAYPDVRLSIPDSSSELGLSDDELDTLTAGTLQFGDPNSGPISISSDITRPAATNVNLTSGGSIRFTGGPIDTDGGDLILTHGASSSLYVPKMSNDVTVGATGKMSLGAGSSLFIDLRGETVDSQYDQLNVVGNIDLTGVGLIPGFNFQPAAGDRFTIINNVGNGNTSGEFSFPPDQGFGRVSGATASGPIDVIFQINYHGGDGNDVVVTVVRNDAPTLDEISYPSAIDEDADEQLISLSGISSGDQFSTVLSVTAASDNPLLIPDPDVMYSIVDGTGSLHFKPLPDQFGVAHITVRVKDNGGTGDGGADTITQTFTVTVNPVNDPPSFTLGGVGACSTTDENQATHGPALQQTCVVSSYVQAGPPNESDQTVSFNLTNENPALFTFNEQPKLSFNGNLIELTFTRMPNTSGNAKLTITATDSEGYSVSQQLNLACTKPHKFHSSADGGDRTGKDVTGSMTTAPDGFIVAGDVLAVVNYINAHGSGPAQSAVNAPPYIDVDADDQVVANDALSIINWINAHPGKSEATAASLPEATNPPGDLISLLASDIAEQASRRRRPQ